jgi:hypothetical protein
MKDLIFRIAGSGLKISQIINAFRMYILPKAEYLMRNSVMTRTRLRKLDAFIGSMLNGKIKGPGLPIELFYISWKDGGLSLTNLEQRYNICKIANLAHLLNDELGSRYRNDMNLSESERTSE